MAGLLSLGASSRVSSSHSKKSAAQPILPPAGRAPPKLSFADDKKKDRGGKKEAEHIWISPRVEIGGAKYISLPVVDSARDGKGKRVTLAEGGRGRPVPGGSLFFKDDLRVALLQMKGGGEGNVSPKKAVGFSDEKNGGQLETTRTFASFRRREKAKKASGKTPPRTPANFLGPTTPPQWFPQNDNSSKRYLDRMKAARNKEWTEDPNVAATRKAEQDHFVEVKFKQNIETVRGNVSTRMHKLLQTKTLLQNARQLDGASARVSKQMMDEHLSRRQLARQKALSEAHRGVLMEQGKRAAEASIRMHTIRQIQAADVREKAVKGKRVIKETDAARLGFFESLRDEKKLAKLEKARKRDEFDPAAYLRSLSVDIDDPPPTQSLFSRA